MILPLAFMDRIYLVGKQLTTQHLAIHHILAATQRNDVNLIPF
jgi:hypothetical protein